MEYITVGKKYNSGKVAKVSCRKNDSLKSIDIKGKCFLLILLTGGTMKFKRGNSEISATAPSFICFNEKENPVLISKTKAKYSCVYFHPDFLNVNMTFDLIRSNKYRDIAETHDMFMLKPFLDEFFVVPICENFIEKCEGACRLLEEELTTQRDWYWSCRGRSYFMELIISLERMYGMIGYGERTVNIDNSSTLKNPKLRDAVLFIEGHYMENITLGDISESGKINHTTLTKLIKEETGMTVSQYLYYYRAMMAKKQLEFTSVPIKDIAARSGFKTVQHFNRTFTNLIGETPASFRKAAVQKRKDGMK